MTYSDIVQEVGELLNLSSAKALARIGRGVNRRYKEVVTSLGLQTAIPATKNASTVIGDRTITFALSKVYRVYNNAVPTQPQMLDEHTVDEIRNWTPISDPAQNYAVLRLGANTTTLFLDAIPASVYALTADGLDQADVLSDAMEPMFPEAYHDILIHGAKEIELRKMEKKAEADAELGVFQQRLAELRFFAAKSAYLTINQGKTNRGRTVSVMVVTT